MGKMGKAAVVVVQLPGARGGAGSKGGPHEERGAPDL
jgi:hypothetical protein